MCNGRLHLFQRYALLTNQQLSDQRWQSQQVDNVVAIISHQDRLVTIQRNNVAHGIGFHHKLIQRLRMFYQLLCTLTRQR
ncbi:Uncharacterised protein [Vibrio cholerae]|nr:Uncharacterised protein [Vibrio cholerae]CSD55663.1 Uncharacterised protein [Vibrio cholerae]